VEVHDKNGFLEVEKAFDECLCEEVAEGLHGKDRLTHAHRVISWIVVPDVQLGLLSHCPCFCSGPALDLAALVQINARAYGPREASL
jgi:hypothetical protein